MSQRFPPEDHDDAELPRPNDLPTVREEKKLFTCLFFQIVFFQFCYPDGLQTRNSAVPLKVFSCVLTEAVGFFSLFLFFSKNKQEKTRKLRIDLRLKKKKSKFFFIF